MNWPSSWDLWDPGHPSCQLMGIQTYNPYGKYIDDHPSNTLCNYVELNIIMYNHAYSEIIMYVHRYS